MTVAPHQKAKSPAKVAALPSRGSIEWDSKMNENEHNIHAARVEDLAVFCGLVEEMALDHLGVTTDFNGRPVVLLAPTVASQLHTLVREISRRAKELEASI